MANVKLRSPGIKDTMKDVVAGESKTIEGPSKYVRRIPTVDKMMEDVYSILDQQIDKIRIKSNSFSLEPKDVSALRDYARCLVEMSKEDRELQKQDAALAKLNDLSTEELIQLAQKSIKK